MAGQVVYVSRSAGHSCRIRDTMIACRLGGLAEAAAGDGGGAPPSSGGEVRRFAWRKPFWVDPAVGMDFSPLNGDGKGGSDMGCVWQSEYAPEPRYADARALQRAPARHRKPSLWRRAATVPGPVVMATIGRVRWNPGRLAPQARWR